MLNPLANLMYGFDCEQAQVWNHTFYWFCLTPNPSAPPSGDFVKAVTKDFGSLDNFKDQVSPTNFFFFFVS